MGGAGGEEREEEKGPNPVVSVFRRETQGRWHKGRR